MSRTTPTSPHQREVTHLEPHRWQPGQSGNPKGRPKGQIDRVHRLQLEAAASGATPLEILLAIARKDAVALERLQIDPEECTLTVRKSAAEACLAYLHRKMPIAVESNLDASVEVYADAMRFLAPEELHYIEVTLEKALAKAKDFTHDDETPTDPLE